MRIAKPDMSSLNACVGNGRAPEVNGALMINHTLTTIFRIYFYVIIRKVTGPDTGRLLTRM
jgi:hypothetical protein